MSKDFSSPGTTPQAVGGVRSRKVKRPKPASGEAFGILNPHGDLWTHDTFWTADAAKDYVRRFWTWPDGQLQNNIRLADFKVIPVRVTVSALPPPPVQSEGA